MSRKRTGRKRKQPEPSQPKGQTDRLGKPSSWLRTFLIGALASLLSAILFLQLDSPRSMLGAIRRLEYENIDDATRLKTPRATTWEDVFTTRNKVLINHPDKNAHDALERLLKLVIDVEHQSIDPTAAVTQGAAYLRLNSENRVARLAYAALIDMSAATSSSGQTPVEQRVAALHDVIEADPPPTRTTLHDAAFRVAWHKVLQRFFDRPDVAASLAPGFYPYDIKNHTEALPIIQHRLQTLSEELNRSGHAQDAADCLHWMARCLLDLIATETDAGTRLLCTDLLGRCVEPDSRAAEGLRSFRADYHAAVLRADVDLADQAFSRTRSVAPGPYRWAIRLLIASIVSAAIAIGAIIALAAACLAAPIARLFRRTETPDNPITRSVLFRSLLILIPTGALAILIPVRFSHHGPYSTYWLLALILTTSAAGFLFALVSTVQWTATGTGRRRVRRMLPMILTAVVILIPALHPRVITHVSRYIDLSIGGSWIIVLVLPVLILAVTLLARPRARDFAASASLVWLINITLAFGLYQAHQVADAKYQSASVEGHRDEIAARLGPDWQTQYLKPAYDAFEIPRP